MARFRELLNKVTAIGDHSACTVIATAIVCGCSHASADKVVTEVGGRERGRGIYFNGTELMHNVLAKFGKVATCEYSRERDYRPGVRGFSLKTVAQRYPRGRYLVFVRGHVAALRNGKLDDWSEGRSHTVQAVYRITGNQAA